MASVTGPAPTVKWCECAESGDDIQGPARCVACRRAKPRSWKRGVVRSWSQGSRRRMFRRIASIEWGLAGGSWCLITLTWPGSFAGDPRTWKAQLSALRLRWHRHFDVQMSAMWVLEWQRPRRSGASAGQAGPHFHLAAAMPVQADITAVRAFVATAWNALVAPGDGDHLEHGAHVGPADVATVPFYLAREVGKRRQKELPPEWARSGADRWWGAWNLSPMEGEEELTDFEYFKVRRVLRRLVRRGTKPIGGYCDLRTRRMYTSLGSFDGAYEARARYRNQGLTAFSRGPAWSLFNVVMHFLSVLRAEADARASVRPSRREPQQRG